eukprot:180171_1
MADQTAQHSRCNKRHVITPEKCVIYWDFVDCPIANSYQLREMTHSLKTKIYTLRKKELPLEFKCYIPMNTKHILIDDKLAAQFDSYGIMLHYIPSSKSQSVQKRIMVDMALDLYEWKGYARHSIGLISNDKDFSHLLSRIHKTAEVVRSFLITLRSLKDLNQNLIQSVDHVIHSLLPNTLHHNRQHYDDTNSKVGFEIYYKHRNTLKLDASVVSDMTAYKLDDEMKSPAKQLCKRNKSNNTVPLVRIDSDDVHQTHSHYHQMNHHIEHTTDVKYMYRNKTRGYLIRIDKEGAHKTIFALNKQITTVGRRKSNDIQLMHATISAKHARVNIDNHVAVVIDLNSTNRTRIGNELPAKAQLNKKIMPNKECVIQSGHYVSFGDCHFVFYHEHDYGELQRTIQQNLRML